MAFSRILYETHHFMKAVQDNFSAGAADYARYRPDSPDGIYDFIYAHSPRFGTAWDCGTGNGQVAIRLASKFEDVYATDISDEQLKLAPQQPNIIYRKERAEATSLHDHSVDLITIAQAIHWFDFDQFYKEVKRVARPDALIAAWTYSLMKLTPEVNKIIDHFYRDVTGPYWDKERHLVDEGYASIPFPFQEIKAPDIFITRHWTLSELIGYLRTWSGVQHYIRQKQQDPTIELEKELRTVWGHSEKLEVRWPVHVRAGRVG